MARLVQRDDMNDIPSDSGIEPGAASGDTASSVDAARDGVKSRRIADDITNTVAPQLIDQLSDVLPKLTEEQDKQKKNDSIGSKLMKAKMAAAIISHIPAILGCLCAVAGLGSMVSCAMGFGSGEEETVTTGVSTMMIGDDTAYQAAAAAETTMTALASLSATGCSTTKTTRAHGAARLSADRRGAPLAAS